MKTLVNILLTGLLIAAGVWLYRTPYNPCDTPRTYKIGFVDPRFGLDSRRLLDDTAQAVSLLDNAVGKPLFIYASGSGIITVNFIFDQRTKLNRDISQLEDQLSQENADLKEKIADYEADVKIFEQKITDLNTTIRKYNSQGGAPPDIYDRIIQQQQALKSEGEALNTRAGQLNLAARDYNSQVEGLNQNVNQFNQAIAQKPEEGLYEEAGNTITIYFVDNQPELIHTLAHEFGHALGLAHVSDPQAIMYPYTTSYLTVTADDVRELNLVCKEEPLPVYWFNLVKDKLNRFSPVVTGT